MSFQDECQAVPGCLPQPAVSDVSHGASVLSEGWGRYKGKTRPQQQPHPHPQQQQQQVGVWPTTVLTCAGQPHPCWSHLYNAFGKPQMINVRTTLLLATVTSRGHWGIHFHHSQPRNNTSYITKRDKYTKIRTKDKIQYCTHNVTTHGGCCASHHSNLESSASILNIITWHHL